MRNKQLGLSQYEQFRLEIDAPLSLKDTLTLLNKQSLTRYEQETAINSIKENICTMLFEAESGRPVINQPTLREYVGILHTVSARLGVAIYEEFKQERVQAQSRVNQPYLNQVQPHMFINGNNINMAHMSY